MNPSEPRIMAFCDGSNVLTEMGKFFGVPFRSEKPTLRTIQIAKAIIDTARNKIGGVQYIRPIRSYWFASYVGDDKHHAIYREWLRQCDFEPQLFKKERNGREKGVDINLTRVTLVNAFHRNFDVGFLVAGDEDYVPLVEETKRYGCQMYGQFFPNGLASELRLAFDYFKPLGLEGGFSQPELEGYKQQLQAEFPAANNNPGP